MIKEFVDRWDSKKDHLESWLKTKHPDSYKELVTKVMEMLEDENWEYGECPDSSQITEIDNGDYQGTLLYLIPVKTYQPNDYYFVKVGYGSCSGCDTLEGIRCYEDTPPREDQVKDYMTLALHIVQKLKILGGDVA